MNLEATPQNTTIDLLEKLKTNSDIELPEFG